MKLTEIPLVIGALKTIPKSMEKELKDLKIRGQKVNIQTTASLTSARIQRRILEICCQSNSNNRLSANAGEKNSQGLTIIIIIDNIKTNRKITKKLKHKWKK